MNALLNTENIVTFAISLVVFIALLKYYAPAFLFKDVDVGGGKTEKQLCYYRLIGASAVLAVVATYCYHLLKDKLQVPRIRENYYDLYDD